RDRHAHPAACPSVDGTSYLAGAGLHEHVDPDTGDRLGAALSSTEGTRWEGASAHYASGAIPPDGDSPCTCAGILIGGRGSARTLSTAGIPPRALDRSLDSAAARAGMGLGGGVVVGGIRSGFVFEPFRVQCAGRQFVVSRLR